MKAKLNLGESGEGGKEGTCMTEPETQGLGATEASVNPGLGGGARGWSRMEAGRPVRREAITRRELLVIWNRMLVMEIARRGVELKYI